MTAAHPLIRAFAHVSFAMGTAAKRFFGLVIDWPPERELSPKAEAFAWRVGYTYRRQLPKHLADDAVSRKVAHQWVNIGGEKFLLECSSCKRQAWHNTDRQINAPCPGPPEPPKLKTPRKRSTAEQGAGPAVKSPDDAPKTQELPFDAI